MNGIWCLHGDVDVEAVAPRARTTYLATPPSSPVMTKTGPVATIYITGTMTPYGPKERDDDYGVRVVDLIEAVNRAAADPAIEAVVFLADSPGGSVLLIRELADAIFALRQKKRTVGVVTGGLCCSACYWVLSQCHRIVATRGSLIGSIGVYHTLIDSSEMLARLGLKVKVVRSVPGKAVGHPGEPVDEKTIENIRQKVDMVHRDFVLDVHRGRGLMGGKIIEAVGGDVWNGENALNMGLIDEVIPSTSGVIAAVGWQNILSDHHERFAAAVAATEKRDAEKRLRWSLTHR